MARGTVVMMTLVNEEDLSRIVLYETKLDEKGFHITRLDEHKWLIHGDRIERIFRMTNISTDEGLLYLTSLLRKMGVEDELRDQGIQEGDTVKLVDFEFDYRSSHGSNAREFPCYHRCDAAKHYHSVSFESLPF